MPPRLDATSAGCTGGLLGYLTLFFVLYWATGWWGWLVFAGPGILLLAWTVINGLRGLLLLAECRRAFEARGVRCLMIYSESPTWERHVREVWLPRLGKRAVTLNWSARASWRRSLEVRLFKRFVRSRRNYNPAVLVFRGLRRPAVYRFYYAFQQAKHGRTQYLDALEAELFRELGV